MNWEEIIKLFSLRDKMDLEDAVQYIIKERQGKYGHNNGKPK